MEELLNPDTRFKLDVLLAEYSRIKEEIFHHKTTQQTIVNFIILLASAEIAGLSQFSSLIQTVPLLSLLVIPIPFALLAMYHTGYTMRIVKLATYLDKDLRLKIESLVGEGLLRSVSYRPTPNVFALGRSTRDGRLTYLALMGLMLLPQAIPLALFYYLNHQWRVLEIALFALVCAIAVVSVTGQHD